MNELKQFAISILLMYTLRKSRQFIFDERLIKVKESHK